jgi:drug/metabolite transporter (DMT)-like permease
VRANLPRVAPLLARFGEELVRLRYWSLLWPLAGAALVALAWQRRPFAGPLALALVAPLGGALAAYMFTALEPYDFHVETSLDRLVLQLVPLAVLVVVLVLGQPFLASTKPRATAVER